jgi:hypothetical protein
VGLAAHDLKQWYKQWDESKSILIGGLGKIFVDGSKKLITLKILEDSWFRFLDVCIQAIASESNEVRVSIFKAIKSLLSSKQLSSTETKPCWEGTFVKWKSMVNQMLAQKAMANQESFLALSSCFVDIYILCGTSIVIDDIRSCFDQFKAMINYQFVGEIIGDTENPTLLQQSILDNLSLVKLGSPQEECFKIEVLCQICGLPFQKRMLLDCTESGQAVKKTISQSSFLAVTRKSLSQISTHLKDKTICKATISSGIFKKVIDVSY